MNNRQREESLTLEILEAIEQRDDLTQRHLANKLGVALGLANSYLKRCVRKGLVKIHQAPANRYLYYLTPTGFAEKSRLTAKYLSISFDFYRNAGNSFRKLYGFSQQQGWEKILFCGISELAEIASLRIVEYGLDHKATYQPGTSVDMFLGKPVLNNLDECLDVDACLITTLDTPNEMYQKMISRFDKKRVLVPEILGLTH
ncbi:MAG: winged helix-turn-helix transcriptional regulator [Candidatus Anammoxibacter sp.]